LEEGRRSSSQTLSTRETKTTMRHNGVQELMVARAWRDWRGGCLQCVGMWRVKDMGTAL